MSKCHNILKLTIDSETAIVCHSLGCLAALNFLSKLARGSAGVLILVAPPTRSRLIETEFEILLPFFADLDLKNVRKRIKNCHVFAADNDQWVDPKKAKSLANELGGIYHLVKGGAHLSVPAGFYTFPEIAEQLGLLDGAKKCVEKHE